MLPILTNWSHEWYGLWSEGILKHRPNLEDCVDPEVPADLGLVLFYLKTSPVLEVYPLFQPCKICQENIKHGLYTDNELVWAMSLSHFIERHGIGLPKRFLEKIRNSKYSPPGERIRERDYFNIPKLEKRSHQ